MKNYYSSNPTFYLGIDCIIFGFNEGEISLLLLKRNFEPAMGEWSLMGGFVQKDESVDDAAKRVLAELTGLENVYMEQVGAFGAIDRDPGERVVSIAYYALININEYDRELVQKHNAYWVNINELPALIFDHDPTRSEQNPSLFYGPDNAVWAMYTAQLDRVEGKDNMQFTAVVRCQKSTDGGKTWGAYTTVFPEEGFIGDRENRRMDG